MLVRAESEAALGDRITELLRFWGWEPGGEMARRVRGHRGDAALPRFGLPEAEYAELAASCTHIIHSAGTVRMNLSIEDARHSAVDSAHEILTLGRLLATNGRLRKIEYVSTVGVAGKRVGNLPEAWLDELPAFHNTYEQAKAESEALVRDAVLKERLPVTVHRPSMVIGDSRTGRIIHFQIFYFLCEFLSGRRTMGLYPDFGEVRLDTIPVDCVAEAIVAASRDPDTAGKIFHLSSGPEMAPRLEDVKTTVRKVFADRGISVPRGIDMPIKWYAGLARVLARMAPPQQRKVLATLPIYLDYLADRQGFDNRAFLAWQERRERPLPRWQDYLPLVLGYYVTNYYAK